MRDRRDHADQPPWPVLPVREGTGPPSAARSAATNESRPVPWDGALAKTVPSRDRPEPRPPRTATPPSRDRPQPRPSPPATGPSRDRPQPRPSLAAAAPEP